MQSKLIRPIILSIVVSIGISGAVQASNEILQDIQVSGVRVQLVRSTNLHSEFYQPCQGRRYRDSIEVSGVINSDTSFIIGNMLKQIAETMPCSPRRMTPRPIVILKSGGGLVYDGFKIGEMLRWYGAEVAVLGWNGGFDVCASSCALAFLGGLGRQMNGRIVFHAPYTYVGNTRQINCKNSKVNADLKRYYRMMIGKENGNRLYDRTMRYCSTEDGWVVNKDAALMYGIANWSP